jgi:UDP-N-acetylglucosamine 2-epimerase
MSVIRALGEAGVDQALIHTGQHYDARMSGVFFADLGLPEPDVNLHVGSGAHGEQTAAVIAGAERELMNRRPALLVVYGDVNSTLGRRWRRPSCTCRSRTSRRGCGASMTRCRRRSTAG